jgi:hypothetical protein
LGPCRTLTARLTHLDKRGCPLKLPFRPARLGPIVPGAILLALAVLGLLVSAPARAAIMIPGGTIRPKDFSLVKKDGYYHLFFIRHNTALPSELTETDFGHARSNDLYHWTILPSVFPVRPGDWDNQHVWAPHIIQRDGLWWMFYTGVTTTPGQFNQTQRMGVAVSSDLETWNRLDGPIFDASQTSWGWWAPLNSDPAFRDPFVMPDPALPGGWLMYYTGSYGADTAATVVGVAASDGDFTQWRDLKPLLITWRNYTFNLLTESPHVFEHNGTWYLFLTSSAGQPLSFYTSADPVGDPAQWTYRGRLRNMLGFDTSTWFASETFRDGTRDLFTFINGDRVELREIRWSAGWEFTLVQPPLMHVLKTDWVYPLAYSGEQATLKTVIANPLAGTLDFETLVVDPNGVETVVPPESLGFNHSPQAWTDTSYIAWVARRWPHVPDTDTVTVSRYRFRCSDQTAQSGILTVRSPRQVTTPDDGEKEPPNDTPVEPVEWMSRHSIMRGLAGTPLGGGPALAIELQSPAQVRVDLFDLSGRRVRNLADRVLPTGATVLPWDGRNDAGQAMPRGVYFARLTGPGLSASARLLLSPR